MREHRRCVFSHLCWQKTGRAICSAMPPHTHQHFQCKLTPQRSACHASFGWSCFWIRSEDWCPASVWGLRAASLLRTRPASVCWSPLPTGHRHKSSNFTPSRHHTGSIFRQFSTHFRQLLQDFLPLLLCHDGAVQIDLWPRVFISLLQRLRIQKTYGFENTFNLVSLGLSNRPQTAAISCWKIKPLKDHLTTYITSAFWPSFTRKEQWIM